MGQSVDVTQLLSELEYYLGKVLVHEKLSPSSEQLRKDFVEKLECLGLPDALSDPSDTKDNGGDMLIFPSDEEERKANSNALSNPNHTVSGDSKHVFACTHCDVKFSCVKSLIQHQRQHYSRKETKTASVSSVTPTSYICVNCRQQFGSSNALTLHVRQEHVKEEGATRDASQLSCSDCGVYFSDRRSYDKHMKVLHSAKKAKLQCSFCEMTFGVPSQLKRHELSHGGEKRYLCGVCGSRFLTASHLAQHQKIHSDVKPHVCTQCNASFVRVFQLKRHMRRHTGERPYVCSYCGAAFSHAARLKYHTMRHTGEKPFCCGSCGTAFRESHHLKAHMRTHTSTRAYPCMLCDSAFASETAQRRHMASHTVPLSQHTTSLAQHTANPGHAPGHAHPDTLTLTLWNTVAI